jgi:hypothetical protein
LDPRPIKKKRFYAKRLILVTSQTLKNKTNEEQKRVNNRSLPMQWNILKLSDNLVHQVNQIMTTRQIPSMLQPTMLLPTILQCYNILKSHKITASFEVFFGFSVCFVTHYDTKCVKNGITFCQCILGCAQPQPLYALRATIPGPAVRMVAHRASLLPIKRH